MYTIKSLKTWNTRDGGGFQCQLLRDGKKVAEVTNDGNGGCFQFDWFKPQAATVTSQLYDGKLYEYQGCVEEAQLWSVCRAVPPYEYHGTMMTTNPDMLVSDLVSELELEKQLKRWLKHPVVVEGGAVSQFKQSPLTDDLRAHIRKTYPEGVILNDLSFTEAMAIARKLQHQE